MRIIIPCIITKFLFLLRFHALLEGLMLLSGIDMNMKCDGGFSNWVGLECNATLMKMTHKSKKSGHSDH